jgi:hypothetical protein
MTQEQLNEIAAAAHESLDSLLAEMTEVLRRRGLTDVRVCSFHIEPDKPRGESLAVVVPPGCRVLPNGTIFCG